MRARVVPFHKGAAVRLQPEAPAKSTFVAKAERLQREQPHAAALIEETIDDILGNSDADGGGKGA